MKLSSIIIRDKLPALSANHLTVDKNGYEMTFEAGWVTVKRPQFPDESPWKIPVSNILGVQELLVAPEKPKRKTPAGEPIPEPVSVPIPPEKK